MGTVEAYALALMLAIGLAVLLGSRGLWLAGAVLLVEFLACNGAVAASGRIDPAEAFALLHFLSAWLLLRDNRHSAEVIIGGIYAALFLVDGLYLLLNLAAFAGWRWVPGPPSAGLFLWITAGGGWAQIAALAAGGVADVRGKRMFAGDQRRGVVVGVALAGAALAAGVAQAAGP
jgi:hypothetical protein